MRRLVIGTRGSALALRQVEIVIAALQTASTGLTVETRVIRTQGDRDQSVSLEAVGGQGVFVKDIERDLLSCAVDMAVHSLKDMPAETPAGLTIAAVLPRADVRDALASRGGLRLQELPAGARVGTDSRRRAIQLQALRPDIVVESIRGNVDTRLRKAEAGEVDAAVLAVAGLQRLGLLDRAAQVFEPAEMLPAAGQGALAIETRAGDAELIALLQTIDDAETHAAVTAERAYLRRLGAGCRLPVGAYATIDSQTLRLQAMLGDDGGDMHREALSGYVRDAEAIGVRLADRLLARVANETEGGSS